MNKKLRSKIEAIVLCLIFIGLGFVAGYNIAIRDAQPKKVGNHYEITFGRTTHYYE